MPLWPRETWKVAKKRWVSCRQRGVEGTGTPKGNELLPEMISWMICQMDRWMMHLFFEGFGVVKDWLNAGSCRKSIGVVMKLLVSMISCGNCRSQMMTPPGTNNLIKGGLVEESSQITLKFLKWYFSLQQSWFQGCVGVSFYRIADLKRKDIWFPMIHLKLPVLARICRFAIFLRRISLSPKRWGGTSVIEMNFHHSVFVDET